MSAREVPERSAVRRTLAILRPHVGRHLPLVAGGMLALLADAALRILEPWPVKFAVDAVSQALGARFDDVTGIGLSPTGTIVAAAIAGIAG